MLPSIDELFRDVRYSSRSLAKTPAFTVLCVAVLALGIAVNSAMFTFIASVLFHNTTTKNADELVVVAGRQEGNSQFVDFSYPDFLDLKQESTQAFSDMLAYDVSFSGLAINGQAHDVLTLYVSDNFFSMLNVHPQIGRRIEPVSGIAPTSPNPVVVLSHAFWQRNYSADPSIVGKTALLDGFPVTVVGVLDENFNGPNAFYSPAVYAPLNQLAVEKKCSCAVVRGPGDLRVLALLRPGVRRTEAAAVVNVIGQRLAKQYPEMKGMHYEVIPEPLANPQPDAAAYWPLVISLVMGLAGIVLVLAVANVTNLLFVRATARHSEMAIKLALGARRWQIVRQLLWENFFLAVLAGGVGIGLGIALSKYLGSIARPIDVPMFQIQIHSDWHVIAFTLALTILVGLAMAAISARTMLSSWRTVSSSEGRSFTQGRTMRRIRNILVVAQITASTILLMAAGIFLKALHTAQTVDFGFDPHNVSNITMDLKDAGYNEVGARRFYEELLNKVRTYPGVTSAAYAFSVPYASDYKTTPIHAEFRPLEPNQQAPMALRNEVSSDYFAVMQIPILQGHGFRDTDVEGAPHVAVVNQVIANHFWPGQDAVGKRFAVGTSQAWIEVIGISRNVNYVSPMTSISPYYYVPISQLSEFDFKRTLQIRSATSPQEMLPAILALVHSLAPDVPVSSALTMDQQLHGLSGLYLLHVNLGISSIFGLLGLMLAVVGIYAIVASTTSYRSKEIAIRMALGADKIRILKMLIRQAVALIAIGECLGIALSIPISSLLASALPSLVANEAVVFVLTAFVVAGTALLASYLPSRRASRSDPTLILHTE